MRSSSFFTELKRRNVYKIAVAYAVVSWLLVQAASIVFPTFEAPAWVLKVFIAATVAGFPIALVIAWAFEMTPVGIKRTEDVSANDRTPHASRRTFVTLIAAVAVVAAGLLGFQLWRNRSSSTAASASQKSIAILPFENLSKDPENVFFTEGVEDEILTRLSEIADLKVISRTSTQRYQSKPGDLPEIAKQLGVSNFLEGSVQKAADQVRVNIQLINAATDAHLWGDTYDRKLTDVFAVESEIAKKVAVKLHAKLSGSAEHVLASRPTESPEAHQLYLKGRYFWNKRTTSNLEKAIDYFQQAIDKDPGYALAYAGLADAHALLPDYARTPAKDNIPKALAAARKAVELDDSLAEAHTSMANALQADLQFAAAILEFQRAIALNPNYATARQWYGEMLEAEGRADEAAAELKRAQELDPLSVIINAALGSILGTARRYDEALEQLRKTVEMDPTFYISHWYLGGVLQDTGALPEAIAEYEKAVTLDPDQNVLASLASAYALAGRKDDARKILDDLTKISRQRYIPGYVLAIVHLALDEKEEALRLLEKSYSDREADLITDVKIDRRLNSLRGDPRFETLIKRVFTGNPR